MGPLCLRRRGMRWGGLLGAGLDPRPAPASDPPLPARIMLARGGAARGGAARGRAAPLPPPPPQPARSLGPSCLRGGGLRVAGRVCPPTPSSVGLARGGERGRRRVGGPPQSDHRARGRGPQTPHGGGAWLGPPTTRSSSGERGAVTGGGKGCCAVSFFATIFRATLPSLSRGTLSSGDVVWKGGCAVPFSPLVLDGVCSRG